jgi:hypothetical protein
MNDVQKTTMLNFIEDNLDNNAKRAYLKLLQYDVDSQIRENAIRFQFNIPSIIIQDDVVKLFEQLNAQYITCSIELNYGNTGVTMFCYNFGVKHKIN